MHKPTPSQKKEIVNETEELVVSETVAQVAEGKKIPFLDQSHIDIKELKTFVFDSKRQLIQITTDEFSAVCPFSGLPDIATLAIDYYPNGGKAIELKSLKYYLLSFRNVGIYQEAVTKRIFEDLKKVLGTNQVTVQTTYNTRGGIDVVCTESGISN